MVSLKVKFSGTKLILVFTLNVCINTPCVVHFRKIVFHANWYYFSQNWFYSFILSEFQLISTFFRFKPNLATLPYMVNNGPLKKYIVMKCCFWNPNTTWNNFSNVRIVSGAARFEWTKKISIRVENTFTEVQRHRACAWQPLFYAATRTHCESGNDHAALSRFDPERTTINVFWLWWWGVDGMTVMVSHTQYGTILGGTFPSRITRKRLWTLQTIFFSDPRGEGRNWACTASCWNRIGFRVW